MRLCLKEETVILKWAQRTLPGVGEVSYRLCAERGRRGAPEEYGISVSLRTEAGEESRYIPSVTTDRAFASRLWRAIVLGRVTPCTLTDVVVDYIENL